MNKINPNLQTVLDNFAQNSLPNGKKSDEYRNLITAVTTSPIPQYRSGKRLFGKTGYQPKSECRCGYNVSKTRISINLSQLKTRLLFQTTFLDKRSSERSASQF